MWKTSDIDLVRHELELARRTAGMLTDPTSADALRNYIVELEREIDRRGAAPRNDDDVARDGARGVTRDAAKTAEAS